MTALSRVAYRVEGLQFRVLHRDLVQTGTMTDRAFHDAVLKLGWMPVEMADASVAGPPFMRDYTGQCKFYGSPLESRSAR